ncbi:MAG: thiamine diphosphokinase [Candidatus Limivicinus sp.]
MKKCLIVGGAPIADYERVKSLLKDEYFTIYCDCGLRHREKLGIEPDLVVGDFDSHPRPEGTGETIVLPCVKDDTDSVYAVKEALRRGFREFVLIGAVGARFDHTMANISLLLMLDKNGARGLIIDDHSRMELAGQETKYVDEGCIFFSLLSIAGPARGIEIKNAKYPLHDGEITPEYQYGVSNEVLPGKRAEISVAEGELLLVIIDRK